MEMNNALWLVLAFYLCLVTSQVEGRSKSKDKERSEGKDRSRSRGQHQRLSFLPPVSGSSKKPNIILVLTDDQDVVLGSMTAMNKTRFHLGSRGAEFTNAFVTTPMCCPSRSSILTGQYVHNHQVFSNIGEYCGSDEWRMGPELANFGTYLQGANYRTGYFGKYLNEYRGDYIPPGWVEWVGLVKNSKFYNYTLCRNGQLMRHGFNYHRDYLPDLIANDSMAFFKLSKRAYPRLPVAMVLSFPSPHGPEDGAPQYQDMFEGNKLHRTPAWNYGPNEDKHWIIRQASRMTKLERDFTDALQRKRLITLLSVDDAIEKLCRELEALGELDNTYILMTSDHGYHLGQFNMLKGKSNAYDTDIRVPFYIRGPDIPHGIRVPNIVLNIDLAPTMLDMAGVNIPPHMDGTSIMKLFQPISNYKIARKSKKWKYVGSEPWRESFLVEKTRSPEEMGRYMERVNRPTKADLMKQECEHPDLQPPCKWGQSKVCVEDADGSLHLRKCRTKSKKKCVCTPPPVVTGDVKDMSRTERRQQRKILKLRSDSNQGGFKSRSSLRGKREIVGEPEEDEINNEVIDNAGLETMCEILQNETIICDNEVFSSRQAWREHRKSVENQLRYLRRYMDKLKDIKTFLKNYRPDKGLLDTFPDDKTAFSIELSGELEYPSDDDEDMPRGQIQSTAPPARDRTVSSSVLRTFENIGQNTGSNIQPEEVEGGEEQREVGPGNNLDRTRGETPNRGRTNGNKELDRDHVEGILGEECTCKDVEVLEAEDEDLEIEIPMIETEEFSDPEDEDDDDDGVKDIEEDVEEYIESPLLQMQRDDQNQVLSKSERTKAKARAKKLKRKVIIQEKKPCKQTRLSCFHFDRNHWKTPPFWNQGEICACLNTMNNSYYCVRTINATHNFIYCEYVTNFVEYFDMTLGADPYQLVNIAYSLDPVSKAELHDQVDELRTCRGRKCSPSSKRRKGSRKNGVSQPTSFWQTLPQTSRYLP
uniref:Heparan sulfate 6-O endosulfatase n=1 Tax=Hemicentrotus pulcherrimus TaxID=7650 RepID=D2KXA4_HEMPU|nr:heparan sulfate 6-O endosulfatase [Hemicentrotus pulcherrimus]